MTYTSTVNKKGQITLPKALRTTLNIKAHQKVIIEVKGKYLKITPAFDITDIAGFLKGKIKRKVNILDAHEAFEKGWSRQGCNV